MVVAADGTKPARVAGRRLPRLLRGALLAVGLSALTWLLSLLIGTGTASADTAPTGQSDPPRTTTQSTGLLGGLVGGLTNILNTTATAVGQLTGGVVNAVPPVVVSPPPAAPESPPPQAEPVVEAKPVARSGPRVSVPVERPAPVAARPAAPTPPPAVPAARKPAPAVRAEVAVAFAVVQRAEPSAAAEQAQPSGPDRSPSKSPPGPPAPAMPTSSVSSGHDGSGQARGTHGVLAGQAGLQPPVEAFTTGEHARGAGDPAAGLPAASPD